MLQVQFIKENTDLIVEGLKKRNFDAEAIFDEILKLDEERRSTQKELDEILGPIDYIASRRTNQLIISVPIGENLVLITAEPDADDKDIIKKAEKLLDDISISTI